MTVVQYPTTGIHVNQLVVEYVPERDDTEDVMEDYAGISKQAETLSLLKVEDDTMISDAVELDGMELPESSFRRCYSTYIRLASFCLHIRSNILEREIDPTPNNINGVWNIRNSFDR